MDRTKQFILKIPEFIFFIIILSLVARLVLRLLGVGTEVAIVAALYSFTDIFVAPFVGIVPETFTVNNFVFNEMQTTVAITAYSVLSFLVAEIMNIFAPKD